MAITRQKKEEILSKLKADFEKATAVYFTEYKGLSVAKIDEMRQKIRESEGGMSVAKKTLIKIAAADAGYKEIPGESMEGPVAAIFAYGDQVTPAKAVYNFLKEFEDLALIGALLDGKALTKAEAQQLATLPSREELLAKLVGSMKAPISGFHGILHGVIREFVGVVAAYKDKKEEEGGAPAPTESSAETEAPKAEETPAEAPATEAAAE